MSLRNPLSKNSVTPTGVAVCVFEITSDAAVVQLTPAGEFRARDGRPQHLPAWKIDRAIAERVIAAFRSQRNPAAIDYEHQLLNAEQNGQPAPAAGWINDLEWREGQGLFGQVQWTERARAYIQAGEYRFFSPVFSFHPKTGELQQLLMGALTNHPAIDGMQELNARAAARFQSIYEETETMNPLLAAVIAALGLAETSTEDQAVAACKTLKAKADGAESEIAALKGRVADPARFVSIETFDQVKTELVALKTQVTQNEVTALIEAGLADGRLLPVQQKWATDLGNRNVAALKGYLDTAQPIAALKASQTTGQKPASDNGPATLTESELAVCKQLGLTAEQFLAHKPKE